MPRTDVSERQFPPGTFDLSLAVGPTALGARLTFTRTASIEAEPEGTVVASCRVLVSDDKAQWQQVSGFTIPGGVVIGKDGQPATTSWKQFTWPGKWNGGVRTAQKRAHVRLELTALVSFRTAISIESLEPV